jgi:hypothetical protein
MLSFGQGTVYSKANATLPASTKVQLMGLGLVGKILLDGMRHHCNWVVFHLLSLNWWSRKRHLLKKNKVLDEQVVTDRLLPLCNRFCFNG